MLPKDFELQSFCGLSEVLGKVRKTWFERDGQGAFGTLHIRCERIDEALHILEFLQSEGAEDWQENPQPPVAARTDSGPRDANGSPVEEGILPSAPTMKELEDAAAKAVPDSQPAEVMKTPERMMETIEEARAREQKDSKAVWSDAVPVGGTVGRVLVGGVWVEAELKMPEAAPSPDPFIKYLKMDSVRHIAEALYRDGYRTLDELVSCCESMRTRNSALGAVKDMRKRLEMLFMVFDGMGVPDAEK